MVLAVAAHDAAIPALANNLISGAAGTHTTPINHTGPPPRSAYDSD